MVQQRKQPSPRESVLRRLREMQRHLERCEQWYQPRGRLASLK